jgi:hypothetical protein
VATDEFLELTHEELIAIAELFGRELPETGIEIPELSEEERAASVRSARRTLVARHIVDVDLEIPEVVVFVAPYDAVCTVLLMSALAVRAGRFSRTGAELRTFRCHPELSVEHLVTPYFTHRLTPFETGELFDRVMDFTGLEPGREVTADARGFTTRRGDLEALEEALLAGTGYDALSSFPDDAESFLAAARDPTKIKSGAIQCIHATESGLAGGDLSWIDTGPGGIWSIEDTGESGAATEPDGRDEIKRVVLQPVSSAALAAAFLGYLPGQVQPAGATD